MTEFDMLRMFQEQARIVCSLVEGYGVHQGWTTSILARAAADVLKTHASFRLVFHETFAKLSQRRTESDMRDEQVEGEILTKILSELAEELAMLRPVAEANPELRQPFSEAQANVDHMQTLLKSQWPWEDRDDERESLAAYQRGEYQDLDEVVRELQSAHPQTDQE